MLAEDVEPSRLGRAQREIRRLVFDLNDFDETLPGPFEWDVKRLAASITVSARTNGFSAKKARAATGTAMGNYRFQNFDPCQTIQLR